MRIYAVADIHGRPERIRAVEEAVSSYGPDVMVLAGDITRLFDSGRSTLEQLGGLGVKTLAVCGNSDGRKTEALLGENGIESIHLRSFVMGGIPFTGVGGAVLIPFRTRIGWMEKKTGEILENLVDENTILVAHPPPWGLLDQMGGNFSAGSRLIRSVVDKKSPRIVLCGHIHERSGRLIHGNTLVVNCSIGKSGSGAIVEIDSKGGSPSVLMID